MNQTLKEMHIELREIYTNQGEKATNKNNNTKSPGESNPYRNAHRALEIHTNQGKKATK